MGERQAGIFNTKLHTFDWVHSGTVPLVKYTYTPTGLTPSGYPIRIRSAHPRSRPAPELPSNKDSIKEFGSIKDNEVIISIEHCDQCEKHQMSTYHKPERYIKRALFLRDYIVRRFPIVKVLIKPTPLKIGAFEVKVCSKIAGSVKGNTLFSKISTKKWPDFEHIINQIKEILPSCNLEINLNQQLEGVQVALYTRNEEFYDKFEDERQKQSINFKLSKFHSQNKRTNTTRIVQKPAKKFPVSQQIYTKSTNSEGICTFYGIPLSNYFVRVTENEKVKGKEIEFECNDAFTNNFYFKFEVNAQLKDKCYVKIFIKDQETSEHAPGLQLQLAGEDTTSILSESSSGFYEGSVKKGYYDLHIPSLLDKKINCTLCELTITKYLEVPRKVTICAVDAVTGKPVPSVKMIVQEENIHEIANETGSSSFILSKSGMYTFESSSKYHVKTSVTLPVQALDSVHYLPMVPTSNKIYLVLIDEENSIELDVYNKYTQFSSKDTDCTEIKCLQIEPTDEIICISALPISDRTAGMAIVNVYANNSQVCSVRVDKTNGTVWNIGYFHEGNFVYVNEWYNVKVKINAIERAINIINTIETPTDLVIKEFSNENNSKEFSESNSDEFICPKLFKAIAKNKFPDHSIDAWVESSSTASGVSLSRLQYSIESKNTETGKSINKESLENPNSTEELAQEEDKAKRIGDVLFSNNVHENDDELEEDIEHDIHLILANMKEVDNSNENETEKNKLESETANVWYEVESLVKEKNRIKIERTKKEITDLCTEVQSTVLDSINTYTENKEEMPPNVKGELREQIDECIEAIQDHQSVSKEIDDYRFFLDWLEILKSLKKRVHKYSPRQLTEVFTT